MLGIMGIAAALTVFGLSLLITKLATVVLAMTGLSREAARFQARSAFTGTGFTTQEAEKVVNHPVRRRVIMALMMLRSAGFVTIIISLILSFAGEGSAEERWWRLLVLAAGGLLLLLLARSDWIDRYVCGGMERTLHRWTGLDTRDYTRLLHLAEDHAVMEMHVQEGDWLEGGELDSCNLNAEGVAVLGINRNDGDYVGAPHAATKVYAGDTLVVYGHKDTLRELDRRQAGAEGEVAHERAVVDQQRRMSDQEARERVHQSRREREGAGEASS